MQFLVIFIAISKIEMTIGKLSTAIRMLLLFALDAMLDKRVRDVANPIDVSKINAPKMVVSWIGLPRNKIKRIYPETDRIEHNRKL